MQQKHDSLFYISLKHSYAYPFSPLYSENKMKTTPLILIIMALCSAKVLNHFEQNTEPTAIVVAVPEEATVQFVPEGE